MELSPTRRGVLWLGLKCDVKCKFCYDELMPSGRKRWLSLDEAKIALNKFRKYYQNEYVDFMGGEPTLHPNVLEIVRHSAEIGLKPTLITHGMRLANREFLEQLVDAGLNDILLSVHGIGDTVREIHQRGRDNSAKQLAALRNMDQLGVAVRFNVTVIQDNLAELSSISRMAVDHGARVVNFLTFNPYFEWGDGDDIPFQVQHSEAAAQLKKSIGILTAAGVEANVRYMPICTMPEYESHVFTGHQLPYDTHEWDYNSWYDMQHAGGPTQAWYRDASARQRERHNYVHTAECRSCAARNICDGLHRQYVERFGSAELRPFTGPIIDDPRHFVSGQTVIAEEPYAEPRIPVDPGLGTPLPLTQFEESVDNRAGIRVELSTKGGDC